MASTIRKAANMLSKELRAKTESFVTEASESDLMLRVLGGN